MKAGRRLACQVEIRRSEDSEIAEPSFVVRRSRDAASTMKAWSRCVRLYEWHLRKLKELKWSATRSGFGFAMLGPSVQP